MNTDRELKLDSALRMALQAAADLYEQVLENNCADSRGLRQEKNSAVIGFARAVQYAIQVRDDLGMPDVSK
jgi:hypothetical protein